MVVDAAQGVVRGLWIIAVAAHMRLCTLGVGIALVRIHLYCSSVADREQKDVDHKHDQGNHWSHVFPPPAKRFQGHRSWRTRAPASLGCCLLLSDGQSSLSDWVWDGLTTSVSGQVGVRWAGWSPAKARDLFIAVQDARPQRVGQLPPVSHWQAIVHPIGSHTRSRSWACPPHR